MEDPVKEGYTPTSSSFIINEGSYTFPRLSSQKISVISDLTYRLLNPDITRKANAFRYSSVKNINDVVEDKCNECDESLETYCHVKLDSIGKLKDSTKKLLYLLEEIQSKTHTKPVKQDGILTLNNFIRPISTIQTNPDGNDIRTDSLRKLQDQASNLETIYVQDEDDDCSIYKKLTRKCHCLNQDHYNDFVIHFNEETKYSTSKTGEIIKNLRILKKFLYMGGIYTKNALMFLNEGISNCQYSEKIEITHGCSHADICNVFDDHSIVVTCISWPCKNSYFGDSVTQALTADLIHHLAQIEEGRRYLNFSSKITNDIRKVLRKKSAVLEIDTIETLNATIGLLKPPFAKSPNINYFCNSTYEGFGFRTLNDLIKFRQYMTLDEILTHLDLLKRFSNNENGKVELTMHLPSILILFKNMLKEFDNSEMNIVITHILNNIVSKNKIKEKDTEKSKVLSIADTATEPIKMKNEVVQIPPKKNIISKKMNKQKLSLGSAPTRNHQSLKPLGWEPSAFISRSKKLTKGNLTSKYTDLRRSIIIVPIEKKYVTG